MAPRRTRTLTERQRYEREHHRDHDRRPWVRERYAVPPCSSSRTA
jgi:hypothetical protein